MVLAVPTLERLRRIVRKIPRGKVMTYGQVASAAGFPGAARLTVRALYGGEELPWHRVVAAGGRIALPGLEGREQRLRLALEGVTFRGGRVRMEAHAWEPRTPRRDRTRKRPASSSSSSPRRRSTVRRRPRSGVGEIADELVGFGPRPKPLRHLRFSRDVGEFDDR